MLMRRLFNPATHRLVRPVVRSPLFQARRCFSEGLEIPSSHASSLTGYTGVAARALWRRAAEQGEQSLTALEQELSKLRNYLSMPSDSEVAEFRETIGAGADGFPSFALSKELATMRRSALDQYVRRLVTKRTKGEDFADAELDAQIADSGFQFSPTLEAALLEIMEAKKFKKVDAVISEFQEVMDAFRGITRATVTAAQELSGEQEHLVKQFLAKEVGGGANVELTVEVDSSLIAGLQIQVGEKVWNMAASHHLQKSKKNLEATMRKRAWSYDQGRLFA